jgi:hypothetical protein
MSMIKIISPSGWDWDRPVAQRIKVSSRGLIGNDRRDFLKSASHLFLPDVDSIKVAEGEVPVHLIALGASEAYGPNRNGDGFKEANCKKYYDTFEKFARFYRNHKNKNPSKSYGNIKKAGYNQPMRRVELLVMLNATKEAADRNGGLVADREMEKISNGDDIPVSMACRVPFDVCSGCGNKAKNRDEYCTGTNCKYGGCKDNLSRVIKVANDTHQLHVDNPDPTWFDISMVFRPADRIAWGGNADYLSKAAADGGHFDLGTIKVAEEMGIQAPLEVILHQEWRQDDRIASQVKLAYALDVLEGAKKGFGGETLRAFSEDMQSVVDLNILGDPGTMKMAEGLGALADRRIVLPMRLFSRIVKRAGLSNEATKHLPGVYGRMISDGSLEDRIRKNSFFVSEKLAAGPQREWAKSMESTYSLAREAVNNRCVLSAIRQNEVPNLKTGFWIDKAASDNRVAEELCREYAIYKLAALQHISRWDNDFTLTARLCVSQNCVL